MTDATGSGGMKHAFLILAHHRFDVLLELLEALDDERSDIFVHVDRKSEKAAREFGLRERANALVKRAGLVFIDPIAVWWGDYSQIRATLRLLERAVQTGYHDYYHLMTGASYPLQPMDALFAFFDQRRGTQFVRMADAVPYERMRYYRRLFRFDLRDASTDMPGRIIYKIARRIDNVYESFQRHLGMDAFRKFKDTTVLRKGLAYWSVTEDMARYTLQQEGWIEERFKCSQCGDELFMQTTIASGPFAKDASNQEIWLSTWDLEGQGMERPGHRFLREDLQLLQSSNAIFALKFDGEDGIWLIQQLKRGPAPQNADASGAAEGSCRQPGE